MQQLPTPEFSCLLITTTRSRLPHADTWVPTGQAKRRMTKSTVVDNETGKSVDSTVRTSTGTFYGRGEDEVCWAA